MTRRNVLTAAVGAGAIGAGVAALRNNGRKQLPDQDRFSDPLLNPPEVEPEVIDVTSSDGTKLHVVAYGRADADPIVLSHGWTCRIEYWNPQINALAGDYRVIAYDQRGHGSSAMGDQRFSADVLADDLAAVLAATVSPDRKAVVAGHSMGGISVLAWAGRYPEQVRRYAGAVLLANTAVDRLVADSKLIPKPANAPDMPLIAGRIVLGTPLPLPILPVTRALFRSRVMSPGATDEQVDFAQRIVFGCAPRVRGRWGTALTRVNVREALAHLDVPTSVITGSLDNLLPPVHSERLAEELDRAGVLSRSEVLPGIGHLANIEAADQVNSELIRLAALARTDDESTQSVSSVS